MTTALVIGLLATPASGADSSMPAALTAAPVLSNPLSLRIATSGGRAGGVRAARMSPSALSGGVSERVWASHSRGAEAGIGSGTRSETCSAHNCEGGDARESNRSRYRISENGNDQTGSATRPRCVSTKRAVAFYTSRLNDWRGKMGAGDMPVDGKPLTLLACPRYLAHLLKRKSYAARLAFGRWHTYQYDWQAWLPDKWQRIGACETGYGHRPGNWRHSNSSYEGAFGFAVGSWDAFTPYADRKAGPYPRNAYLATPRQQYEVALAIQRRYGLSGWGCRNA